MLFVEVSKTETVLLLKDIFILSLYNRSPSSEKVSRCSFCFHSVGIHRKIPYQCKNSTGSSENSRLTIPHGLKLHSHLQDQLWYRCPCSSLHYCITTYRWLLCDSYSIQTGLEWSIHSLQDVWRATPTV